MSKIIKRTQSIIFPVSTYKLQEIDKLNFLPHDLIKEILIINENKIALVKLRTIMIYNLTEDKPQHTIILKNNINKIVFSQNINSFFMLTEDQWELISITNQDQFIIKSQYKFGDNKWRNENKEWAPLLYQFQQSQRIILIRKFYGKSLVVIFQPDGGFKKQWEFSCNEQCLGKLNETNYLINFRQQINKLNITLQIYDVFNKSQQIYKITNNIEPHITKSIKLFQKYSNTVTDKQSETWLIIMMGVNFKVNGLGIIMIRLLEESNNIYQIIGVHSQANYDMYDIVTSNSQQNIILLLQYKYDAQKKSTNLQLCLYKLDESNQMILADCTDVTDSIQSYKYDTNTKTLLIYHNNFNSTLKDNQFTIIKNRIINKKSLYSSFLKQIGNSNNVSLGNQTIRNILNLL